jgi:ACS family tartrate transporter-like MFS transporter
MALTGTKAYLPAFWTLPSLLMTEAAAAGSIGLINSVGNLGGFIGPSMLGWSAEKLGSFRPGLLFLGISMAVSATIILQLGLGRRVDPRIETMEQVDPLAETLVEPV